MEEKEVKKFRNRFFKEFGINLSENDEVFPLIYAITSAAWRVDEKNLQLSGIITQNSEMNEKLKNAIENLDTSSDIMEKRSLHAKKQLFINDQETAFAWWHGRRHYLAMIIAIACMLCGIVFFAISKYSDIGKMEDFYTNSKKETINNTTYILLKPAKDQFKIGENYIILDDKSIAIPIYNNTHQDQP